MVAAANRYVTVQNNTASKERLMVNLFQTALRHIRVGGRDLEQKRRASGNRALDKAAQIIGYLHGTLKRDAAPGLVDNLGEIYTFTAARLCRAIATGKAADAKEAERAFAPIAEGFTEAVSKLTPSRAAP
jgi:flagellar protein FliS